MSEVKYYYTKNKGDYDKLYKHEYIIEKIDDKCKVIWNKPHYKYWDNRVINQNWNGWVDCMSEVKEIDQNTAFLYLI